jgi:hypothetical protein
MTVNKSYAFSSEIVILILHSSYQWICYLKLFNADSHAETNLKLFTNPPHQIKVHSTLEVFHIKFQQNMWDCLRDSWKTSLLASVEVVCFYALVLFIRTPDGKRPLGRHRLGQCGLDWSSSCECGYEPSGSMKCWETIKWLHNWWPLE